jgi:hypothetical protein
MLGWHPLPVSESGADRLYADGAGRRLRISHLMREARPRHDEPQLRPVLLALRIAASNLGLAPAPR